MALSACTFVTRLNGGKKEEDERKCGVKSDLVVIFIFKSVFDALSVRTLQSLSMGAIQGLGTALGASHLACCRA